MNDLALFGLVFVSTCAGNALHKFLDRTLRRRRAMSRIKHRRLQRLWMALESAKEQAREMQEETDDFLRRLYALQSVRCHPPEHRDSCPCPECQCLFPEGRHRAAWPAQSSH